MSQNDRSSKSTSPDKPPNAAQPVVGPASSVDPDATRVVPRRGFALGPQPDAAGAGARAASGDRWTDSGPEAPVRVWSGTLPSAPTRDPSQPRQVGRYLIGECLGRGGMASVYKARDPDIGRDLAIKFLHPSLCEDPEYRSRFLKEAHAAGSLSHPNIVVVHDVGEIEGRPYMAMEFLDGEPLSEEMSRGKPLSVREVVVIGIQLARALAYAHGRGVVHRDIKPGNLMRIKGTRTIKVTDFGIAHLEAPGTESRTRVGDVLGTPEYMSPEQTRGGKLDGRSDLFSAGILLYQLLSGQRPFRADSVVALAVQIATQPPAPIEKLRPDLPASLRRIVERCMAKSPDQRFQTGEELADALVRVLAEIDETERKEGKPRIVPLRVKWAATMALIVAVVMALTATIITQRQYAAMLNQVTDSGAALARFIAAQDAVAALAEDWVSVGVSLEEVMKTGDFHSITVIDRTGIVRASSDPDQVGRLYTAPHSEALNERAGRTSVSRYLVAGEEVLGFEAPITFQNKQVGRVALGLREKPLVKVAQLSVGLMVALVVITVVAVAVAMYFVATWFARPIKLLSESMAEIALGRFAYRIKERRKDEFGELYLAFDRMAQALQDRQAGASHPTPPRPLQAPAPPSS